MSKKRIFQELFRLRQKKTDIQTKVCYVLYLSEEEAHKATSKELKTYWHPKRQRQDEWRKVLADFRKLEC